jgi:sulfite reductase (NADPH) flavoprotein alpha-component
MPLLPRFYSIASSHKVTPNEIHLTVALVKYEADGNLRHGVATNYLAHIAQMHTPSVPIYLQPNHGFTLPAKHETPIIMIGPGTGVAPFRGFLFERLACQAPGKNWLFFGECNKAHDFFYENDWIKFNNLRLTTAFSRDQEHKVYVQHKMLEHARELYEWITSGAYLYVCGDAHRMAKDVEATLHQILQEQGKMDEAGAKAFVKQLRTDKRYLRDVY